ncbi:MAG: hypothetical protein H0X51_03370 [Parachlamydiaceae bacterium]|nr:hypothetical protein [Parachlamydiaceae bacterium]
MSGYLSSIFGSGAGAAAQPAGVPAGGAVTEEAAAIIADDDEVLVPSTKVWDKQRNAEMANALLEQQNKTLLADNARLQKEVAELRSELQKHTNGQKLAGLKEKYEKEKNLQQALIVQMAKTIKSLQETLPKAT